MMMFHLFSNDGARRWLWTSTSWGHTDLRRWANWANVSCLVSLCFHHWSPWTNFFGFYICCISADDRNVWKTGKGTVNNRLVVKTILGFPWMWHSGKGKTWVFFLEGRGPYWQERPPCWQTAPSRYGGTVWQELDKDLSPPPATVKKRTLANALKGGRNSRRYNRGTYGNWMEGI